MNLIEIKSLSHRFGGLQAVNNVTFNIKKGTIKSIIGPNGAGKTTIFNLISGNIKPDQGEIYFKNKPIFGFKPYQIAETGIGRTFQNIKLFSNMTVLENVMTGRHIKSQSGFLKCIFKTFSAVKEEKKILEKSLEILETLEFEKYKNVKATDLSFGQQRTVELARALAMEPEILLLDEPAAGLNIYETAEIAELICKFKEWGITILLVEHDMSLVMDISDELLVLNYGEIVDDGPTMEVRKNKKVIDIYLGEDA